MAKKTTNTTTAQNNVAQALLALTPEERKGVLKAVRALEKAARNTAEEKAKKAALKAAREAELKRKELAIDRKCMEITSFRELYKAVEKVQSRSKDYPKLDCSYRESKKLFNQMLKLLPRDLEHLSADHKRLVTNLEKEGWVQRDNGIRFYNPNGEYIILAANRAGNGIETYDIGPEDRIDRLDNYRFVYRLEGVGYVIVEQYTGLPRIYTNIKDIYHAMENDLFESRVYVHGTIMNYYNTGSNLHTFAKTCPEYQKIKSNNQSEIGSINFSVQMSSLKVYAPQEIKSLVKEGLIKKFEQKCKEEKQLYAQHLKLLDELKMEGGTHAS